MFSVTLLVFSDDTHYIPDILVHLLISLSCRFSILFLPVCYKMQQYNNCLVKSWVNKSTEKQYQKLVVKMEKYSFKPCRFR